MASVKYISILECRLKGHGKVEELRFPTAEAMQEFVNEHRRIVSPKGRVLRAGAWDYAVQRHVMVTHA